MKVIFCIPGKQFSDLWLHSWNDTLAALSRAKHTWAYSIDYDPVVFYARNKVLGGNNIAGKNQKPFQGKAEYDVIVWIDSDMVWKGQDVIDLINSDKHVISGCYLMRDNVHYPIVETLDFTKLATNGIFDFVSREGLATKTQPFKASYVGFGFIAMKRMVLETMEYPWFRPHWVNHDNICDFTAEDVGFCWSAADYGYDIWVDPSIKVGHEKLIVLT
jgi:hypothetical protein